MDDKTRQAEIKRIQDMISRLEAEQEFMSLFEQPSDVSSLPYEEIDLDSVLFDDMEEAPAPMPDFKTSTPVTKTIERLGTEPPAQETASAPTPVVETAVEVPAEPEISNPEVEIPVESIILIPEDEAPVETEIPAPTPTVEATAPVAPAPAPVVETPQQPVAPAPSPAKAIETPVQAANPAAVATPQPATPSPEPAPIFETTPQTASQTPVPVPAEATPVQPQAPATTPVPAVAVPQTEPVIAPPPVPEFQYTTQAVQETSVPAVAPAPPIEAAIPQQAPEPIAATPIITEPAHNPTPAPAPAVAAAPVEPVVAPPPVPEFRYTAQAAQETYAPVPEVPAQARVSAPVVENATRPVATAPVVETVPPIEAALTQRESSPLVENAPQPAAPVEISSTKGGRRTQKRKFRKRAILITVTALCVIMIAAVLVLSHKSLIKLPHSSSSDKKESAVDSASDQVDKISCADGTLKVNNVSVTVPKENATYTISYTWGKDDKDQPTIPHAGTASYYNKDGKLLYDVTLYRDSFTKTKDIPEGKDASNWFSDWSTDDSENNLHKPMDSGSIHGFLLSSTEDSEGDSAGSTYSSTSYYFAVQDKKGLSIYVLEGILYDNASKDTYNELMDDCIKSIKVS